jgi:hypothetical protein
MIVVEIFERSAAPRGPPPGGEGRSELREVSRWFGTGRSRGSAARQVEWLPRVGPGSGLPHHDDRGHFITRRRMPLPHAPSGAQPFC